MTACVLSVGLGVWLCVAPRAWFFVLPLWMLVRMALNAVDGMLAREFGQQTALGTYLNELCDVVSDAALYLPFAFVGPLGAVAVGTVIVVSVISEMAGVVGVMAGASRRYDGPAGKSDRAFWFSLLAIWVGLAEPPPWSQWLLWLLALAIAVTTWTRVRRGLGELS